MKIAVTADLHLTTREQHPERFHALENIVAQAAELGVDKLIIAGDLFDQSCQNYAEFEAVCSQENARNVEFIVLPGNHDDRLSGRALAATNVEVVEAPALRRFGEQSLPFLLLPYLEGKTMGECIAGFAGELPANGWVLVGHGDWSSRLHSQNPAEPGIYMPLTKADVEAYRPVLAVLGHIHKPFDGAPVHYPGSPCGLDISETGRRRFLVVDAETGAVAPRWVDTDHLLFNESFLVLPVPDEQEILAAAIQERIKGWEISAEEQEKVRVQVKCFGYSTDKRALMETLKAGFAAFAFYRDGEPDLSGVSVSEDVNLAEIATQVSAAVRQWEWLEDELSPNRDEVLLQALQVIYGS